MKRLATLDPEADVDSIASHLSTFELVSQGGPRAGPIGELTQAERFHWLVAPRSTVVQVSSVHSGLCEDPRAALDDLFNRLVLPPRS